MWAYPHMGISTPHVVWASRITPRVGKSHDSAMWHRNVGKSHDTANRMTPQCDTACGQISWHRKLHDTACGQIAYRMTPQIAYRMTPQIAWHRKSHDTAMWHRMWANRMTPLIAWYRKLHDTTNRMTPQCDTACGQFAWHRKSHDTAGGVGIAHNTACRHNAWHFIFRYALSLWTWHLNQIALSYCLAAIIAASLHTSKTPILSLLVHKYCCCSLALFVTCKPVLPPVADFVIVNAQLLLLLSCPVCNMQNLSYRP